MPRAPALTSARPGRSRAASAPRLSRMRVSTSGMATSADRDVEPEDPLPGEPFDDRAADERPGATETPVIALKMPIAAPRCSGGKAALSSASPSGMMSAAPTPWSARAAISLPASGASAHSAEAKANSAEPDRVEVAPPVAVTERGGGDEQDGEAQVVGVDGPLERLDGRAEVDADRAQRGRHDQRVERGHQRADGREGDDPAGVMSHAGIDPAGGGNPSLATRSRSAPAA